MKYPVKIICCVVDVRNVTLYKDDGETLVIHQGDTRLKPLVAKLVPAFEPQGQQFYMLTEEDMAVRNSFADTEKKMGGVARFFKMVKTKAAEILDRFAEPILPMALGEVPKPTHEIDGVGQDVVAEPAKPVPPEERPLTKSAAAVAEIMANAVPSSDAGFSAKEEEGAAETTVVAVLEDGTIIPGCEVLDQQALAVSSGMSSGDAMANFLRRAGSIKRGHSVEDLLKFIQKGELPLADDGSVLVYKMLNYTSKEGTFVDVHSGNVKQRVGSFVHMAENMVDPSRGHDCSNGLHVARRDYLCSFSGNVCVLAKLAPEDVIAVPQYDARKLRAKGYHIIARLSDEDYKNVRNNRPMADQVLLGNAVAGNHPPILEYVEITAAKGRGLKISPATEGAEAEPVKLDESLKSSSLDQLEVPGSPVTCVDGRALALSQTATQEKQKFVKPKTPPVVKPSPPLAKATPKKEPKMTQQEQMAKLVGLYHKNPDKQNAKEIVAFKQKAKKGWDVLGVTDAKFIKKITERAKL